jgi:hypothetical protein
LDIGKLDERISAISLIERFRSIGKALSWVAGGSPAFRKELDFGVTFPIGDDSLTIPSRIDKSFTDQPF